MNVSRRQFGSSLGALFGGLFLFRGASAATGSPAVKIPERPVAGSRNMCSTYLMRGTVDTEPVFKEYFGLTGKPGCRLFFYLKAGVTEPTPCVVWGRLAYNLHHKANIRKGTNLIVRGEPTGDATQVYVTLNDVEIVRGSLI